MATRPSRKKPVVPRIPRPSRKRRGSSKPAAAAVTDFAHHPMFGAGHAPKPPVRLDPSPNFASRQGERIIKIVVHNTDGPLAPSLARLKDPAAQVSAHYVVDRTGQIYQLVDDSNTAWHSGNRLVNQQSIGIEVVAWKAAQRMTTAQEGALIQLCRFVLDAYEVPAASFVPHRSVKPTDCPGWVWPTDADLEAWKAAKLP